VRVTETETLKRLWIKSKVDSTAPGCCHSRWRHHASWWQPHDTHITGGSLVMSCLFVEETIQQKRCKDNSGQDKSGSEAITTAIATRHRVITMRTQNRITSQNVVHKTSPFLLLQSGVETFFKWGEKRLH